MERDIKRVVRSPSVCNSQVWTRLKSGARNSILISYMGDRGHSNWPTMCCLSGYTGMELDQKQSIQDTNWHSDIGMPVL